MLLFYNYFYILLLIFIIKFKKEMKKNLILFILLSFQIIELIKTDACSEQTKPSVTTDCTKIAVSRGYQCCMETLSYAISSKSCKLYTDAEASIRTTTTYTGYLYECPGITIPVPTPSPSPSGSSSSSNSTSTNSTSTVQIVSDGQVFTNKESFLLSCAAKVPNSKSDCTNFKYSGYNCCRTKYQLLVGISKSYCMYYTTAEAQTVVTLASKYYEYECSGYSIQALYFLYLLISLYIFIF